MINDAYEGTQLTELYQYLEPELPRCPRALIMSNIQSILVDFFRKTQVWTYLLPDINIVSGEVQYLLEDIPDCSLIDTPKEVRLWYTQAEKDDVKNKGTVILASEAYFMADRDIIELRYEPLSSVTGGLSVQAILRPKRTAEAIPSRIFEDNYQAIVYGTLVRLMVMKGQAWSNNESASLYANMYQDLVGSARVRINKGYMNVELTATSPYMWA